MESKRHSIYLSLLFSLLSHSQMQILFHTPQKCPKILLKTSQPQAYYVETLKEAIETLKNPPPIEILESNLPFMHKNIAGEKYYFETNFALDFKDIKGQERAKRAALIAACGFHNILFEGSAGSGKSMISSRIPYILPPLNLSEILQLASALSKFLL